MFSEVYYKCLVILYLEINVLNYSLFVPGYKRGNYESPFPKFPTQKKFCKGEGTKTDTLSGNFFSSSRCRDLYGLLYVTFTLWTPDATIRSFWPWTNELQRHRTLYVGFSLNWPVNRLCGYVFNRFIAWRYIHSWLVFSTQLVNCYPPWTKELYLCTVAPLTSPPSPPSQTKCTVYTDSVCLRGGRGGGGFELCCRPYSAGILHSVSD